MCDSCGALTASSHPKRSLKSCFFHIFHGRLQVFWTRNLRNLDFNQLFPSQNQTSETGSDFFSPSHLLVTCEEAGGGELAVSGASFIWLEARLCVRGRCF